MFVLLHENGKYVAPPGQQNSYTSKLEEAWTFQTVEQAKLHQCIESEAVVAVASLMYPPNGAIFRR